MIKIIDKYKLDAEEIKRALMVQTDEYRQHFDKMLAERNISEEQRLASLNFTANACAAIFTFLYTKAGIELRTQEGALLSHTGYFMAKISDIEQRIIKRNAAPGVE